MGGKDWGCGLGIFDRVGGNESCQHTGLGISDLAGGNGSPEYVGNGGLSIAYQVYPCCFGLSGARMGLAVGVPRLRDAVFG